MQANVMHPTHSRRISTNAFVFSVDDLKQPKPNLIVESLLEACNLYFLAPFGATHYVNVQLSVVPFSINAHRGQVFYYARAYYATCCSSISARDFMPMLGDASQEIYRLYVHHHYWNFKVHNAWEERKLSQDILETNRSCLERSLEYLNKNIACFEKDANRSSSFTNHNSCSTSQISQQSQVLPINRVSRSTTQISLHTQDLISSPSISPVTTNATLDDSTCASPQSHPCRADSMDPENPALQIADEFVKRLTKVDTRVITLDLCFPSVDVCSTNQNEAEQSAARAWTLCKTTAMRANEQLKHANFTRFISLCFFLCWEMLSCRAGKAGARQMVKINLKMKAAGFEGTSRTLRSLRDETILINQIVASAEQRHGVEIASNVMHRIFDGSNYHLIRLISRYSGIKRQSAIRQISENVPSAPMSTPVFRIQDVIHNLLPGQSIDEIKTAIRYRPLNFAGSLPQGGISTPGYVRNLDSIAGGVDCSAINSNIISTPIDSELALHNVLSDIDILDGRNAHFDLDTPIYCPDIDFDMYLTSLLQ